MSFEERLCLSLELHLGDATPPNLSEKSCNLLLVPTVKEARDLLEEGSCLSTKCFVVQCKANPQITGARVIAG